MELIDTLWNVNRYHSFFNNKRRRINRYIMECKLVILNHSVFIKVELIDTLWNVNSVVPLVFWMVITELIDTLWNVNYYLLFTH